MKKLRYVSLIGLLVMLAISATQVFAECNQVSTNNWLCDGTFAAFTQIRFTAADETIVFPAGTTFTGYAIDGDGGSDTIINNGVFYGLLGGELSSGGGLVSGNDLIINNGSVSYCPADACGGGIIGYDGDDTMINNGSVQALFAGGFGNDTLVNRGTIWAGDLEGDGILFALPPGAIYSGSADDTITNSGTVTGKITGEYGNDTIILEGNANGGDDNYLLIDGGTGEDTLVFTYDNAEVNAAIEANAPNGSITINGQTFEWVNFEHIVKGEGYDGRLNGRIADNARTAAVYCSDDEEVGGVTLYGIDENAHGYLLFSVSSDAIHAALEDAQALGEHVMIAEEVGQSLWALTSNELQVHDVNGEYDFIFSPAVCGIPPAS